jgi:hypothetical protein
MSCPDTARHLAQFNIARIKHPLDDRRMKEFVDNVARVNALAETIDGFVWRLKDNSGHAMNMRVYDDPRILPNLTVWQSVEALERFVWQTLHKLFRRPPRGMVRAYRDAAGAVVRAGGPSADAGKRRRAARSSDRARPERLCFRLGSHPGGAIVEDGALRRTNRACGIKGDRMAKEPENVVLVLLRKIDERTERMADDLQDLKSRVTSVEEGLAGVNRRLDRLDSRVERIERRLKLTDAEH